VTTTIPAEKDGAIARSIAADCVVLLRNQNQQLPLNAKAIHSIALIGPYAGAAHTGGGGSSAVTPLYTVAPIDGLKKHLAADVKIAYDEGKIPAAAAATAKSADVVLLMVGNKDREGRDRSDLSLPDKQDELVSAVQRNAQMSPILESSFAGYKHRKLLAPQVGREPSIPIPLTQ